jgi:predicted transposase YbfD/YdcC
MAAERFVPFLEHFSTLKDPRIERHKLYPLSEVLLLLLCGTICYCESWEDLEAFGEERLDFLREYLPFTHGIPDKNTLSRVMASLNPKEFKESFIRWVASFQLDISGTIAIDGKKLRRSYDKAENSPSIHMVSAFATEARLVLGQVKVDDKSNEITAIPDLLDQIKIKGLIVSIDAMGCQKEIAAKIIDQEGDYVLSLKGNQETLHQDVELFLKTELQKKTMPKHLKFIEEIEKGHGRIERRQYWITEKTDWLDMKPEWKGLRSIGCVRRIREMEGKMSEEWSYFIASIPAKPALFSKAVRNHWGIENRLHWVLDVVFNEDQSRLRSKNTAENMAIIRHFVMNLLQQAKSFHKGSMKQLRKKAGWSTKTLETLLELTF